MLYENCKVYGPYEYDGGRLLVCIIKPDGSRISISYPRYLMELHLNRYLNADETVDHIDRNYRNNQLDNFRIVSLAKNASDDALRLVPQLFNCQVCLKDFMLEGKKLSNAFANQFRRNDGPYCGRSCAGKASHMPGMKRLVIIRDYYRITK